MKKCEKPWDSGLLRVSDNKKYLMNGDKPFFWYGDTSWLMVANLDLDEIRVHLTNRAKKGMNVIQIMVQHGSSLHTPDDTQYWDKFEETVKIGEELGLYMGLVCIWGGVMKRGFLPTLEDVENYAKFLVGRFSKYPNIIWITGGDIEPTFDFDKWCKLGETLREYDKEHIIAYHPRGRTSSSFFFNEEKWLDIHMFQSGHRLTTQYAIRANEIGNQHFNPDQWFGEDNWKYVEYDRKMSVLRPTLDAEPSYETTPQGLGTFSMPRWQDYHVRRYAYWSVLAGSCGHTYGHHSLMTFHKPSFKDDRAPMRYHPSLEEYYKIDTWDVAIHAPGCAQISLLKNLMERFPFHTGDPKQEMLMGDEGEWIARVSVFAGRDFAIAYTYNGREFSLDLSMIEGKKKDCYWMDPANGVFSYCGRFDSAPHTFKPVTKPHGDHNDWVLIAVDSESEYI